MIPDHKTPKVDFLDFLVLVVLVGAVHQGWVPIGHCLRNTTGMTMDGLIEKSGTQQGRRPGPRLEVAALESPDSAVPDSAAPEARDLVESPEDLAALLRVTRTVLGSVVEVVADQGQMARVALVARASRVNRECG
jgi:hypothetical protein